MAEQENTRLASRLLEIGAALARPAAANGHAEEVVADDLSEGLLNALAAALVPFVKESIAKAVAEPIARNAVCEQRIAELESHIIKLEQQPTMKYLGVWNLERTYFIGDFCTDHGSLWHCNKACTGVRPPASYWTLAVQRGRSAKGR